MWYHFQLLITQFPLTFVGFFRFFNMMSFYVGISRFALICARGSLEPVFRPLKVCKFLLGLSVFYQFFRSRLISCFPMVYMLGMTRDTVRAIENMKFFLNNFQGLSIFRRDPMVPTSLC